MQIFDDDIWWVYEKKNILLDFLSSGFVRLCISLISASFFTKIKHTFIIMFALTKSYVLVLKKYTYFGVKIIILKVHTPEMCWELKFERQI